MAYVVVDLSKNITQRIITGIIGVFVLLMGINFGHWGYFSLFLLVSSLCLWEFYTLVGGNGYLPLKIWGSGCAIALYTISYLFVINVVTAKVFLFIVPFFFICFVSRLYKKEADVHFMNLGFTFLGILYCTFPFVLLHLLSHDGVHYNKSFIIGILFLHWASDSGAYLVGKLFGKKKLFERISPKKTWEGSIGGLFITLTTAFVLSRVYPEIIIRHWIILSVIVVIFGTFGDLVESLFKRELNIKDSGFILLGHGGFLDRFDGFFLSLPIITIYHQFFM